MKDDKRGFATPKCLDCGSHSTEIDTTKLTGKIFVRCLNCGQVQDFKK